jgi:hypothetical protein
MGIQRNVQSGKGIKGVDQTRGIPMVQDAVIQQFPMEITSTILLMGGCITRMVIIAMTMVL